MFRSPHKQIPQIALLNNLPLHNDSVESLNGSKRDKEKRPAASYLDIAQFLNSSNKKKKNDKYETEVFSNIEFTNYDGSISTSGDSYDIKMLSEEEQIQLAITESLKCER